MRRTALRIKAFRLPPGSIPNVSVPAGWPMPVCIAKEDGSFVRTILKPGVSWWLSLFEVTGRTREEAVQEVLCMAPTMCLHAGFAGTAVVMVKTDHYVQGTLGRYHLIVAALVFSGWDKRGLSEFTGWEGSDEENIDGFPPNVAVGGEEHLLAMRDAYAVLES